MAEILEFRDDPEGFLGVRVSSVLPESKLRVIDKPCRFEKNQKVVYHTTFCASQTTPKLSKKLVNTTFRPVKFPHWLARFCSNEHWLAQCW